MDLHVLVAKYRKRQKKLDGQIPKLQQEYEENATVLRHLERAIAGVDIDAPLVLFDEPEEGDAVAGVIVPAADPPEVAAVSTPRAPLSERKAALIEYLRHKGRTPRATIVQESGIPEGTLSLLLTRGAEEGWLLRSGKGEWEAKDSA